MSVTIEYLHFYNGITFRECNVPLANQGLVYLRGRNGHGKSTPWEVLQHVFYGSTSRGIRKDALVSLVPRESVDEPEGFLAEVLLCNPSGRWMIRQARGHPKYKTSVRVLKQVDGAWSSKWEDGACPSRLEDAQRLAGTLLGLKAHEFTGCMYLSQDAAHTLIEGTPSEKMQYIAHLFGIDRYDDLIKRLNGEMKDMERDHELSRLDDAEEKLVNIRARLIEIGPFVPSDDQLTTLRATLAIARNITTHYADAQFAARDALKDAQHRQQIERALANLQVNPADYQQIHQERQRMIDERAELADQMAIAKQRREIETELQALGNDTDNSVDDRLEKVRSRIAQEREKIARQNQRDLLENRLKQLPEGPPLREVETELANAKAQLDAITVRNEKQKQEIATIDRQLSIASGGVCPMCLRPLDVADAQAMRERLVGEHDACTAMLEERCDQVGRLTFDLEMASQRDVLERQISAIEQADAESLRKLLTRLELNCERLEKERQARIRREQLRSKLAVLPTDNFDQLCHRAADLDQALNQIETSYDALSQARALKQQLDALPVVDPKAEEHRLHIAEDAAERLAHQLDQVREQLREGEDFADEAFELRKEQDELNQQIDAGKEQQRHLAVIKYAVQTATKLKRRRLHKVVCAVRDVLPRFTSIMFSHEPETRFIVDTDDNESLDLLARRVVSHTSTPLLVPVKSFSGGEKQRLSVALVFTLHALLSPNKRPDLLILDEVDRGLDDRGVASLMTLVREVRELYGTVIMTSHRPQIDGARFDQTWEVVKENEISRLTTNV